MGCANPMDLMSGCIRTRDLRFGSIGIQRESVFPGVVQSQKASVSKNLSLLNLYIMWI